MLLCLQLHKTKPSVPFVMATPITLKQAPVGKGCDEKGAGVNWWEFLDDDSDTIIRKLPLLGISNESDCANTSLLWFSGCNKLNVYSCTTPNALHQHCGCSVRGSGP